MGKANVKPGKHQLGVATDVPGSDGLCVGTDGHELGISLAAAESAQLTPSLLTAEEEEFAYNVAIVGLAPKRAAELAGLEFRKTHQPHVKEAIARYERESLGRLRVTKEDSARGILDAIDRARIIGEPSTEIQGWKEVNAMYGHNAPQKINVQLDATLEVLAKQVKNVPTSELVKLLGAEDVIDGDFRDLGPA